MRILIKKLYHLLPFKLNFLFLILPTIKNKIRLLNKNKVVTKSIDGINYELHLNQFIDSSIYYDGCFEKDTSKAIKKILKPGMYVFDVGANIGCHLLPMAKIVGEKGRVFGFEPMKWPMQKLMRNIELNNFQNITIESIGLSDNEDVKLINFRSSWTLDSSVVEDATKVVNVHFTTIDNYLTKNKIEKIDFIKLDVDGYEFKVLMGARQCLLEHKPIIIMELGDYTLKSAGDNLNDLIDFFYNLEYEFYREKDFKMFNGKHEIIESIPNINEMTINVIVCHGEKSYYLN